MSSFYPANSPMPPSNSATGIYYPSNPSVTNTPMTGQPVTPMTNPMTPMSMTAEASGIVPQLQWVVS